jgi:hypothetical protein
MIKDLKHDVSQFGNMGRGQQIVRSGICNWRKWKI